MTWVTKAFLKEKYQHWQGRQKPQKHAATPAGSTTQAWNPSTQDVEAGESKVQVQLLLNSESKASLSYVNPCVKRELKRKKKATIFQIFQFVCVCVCLMSLYDPHKGIQYVELCLQRLKWKVPKISWNQLVSEWNNKAEWQRTAPCCENSTS